MNRASCYDWIGKFCDCILGQLSSMQKQGDCPAESLEAVSSVIFAAARFADLPELCDLRRLFTEKYGSNLESLVNQEDISQKISVTWDSKGFKHKISIPSATSYLHSCYRYFYHLTMYLQKLKNALLSPDYKPLLKEAKVHVLLKAYPKYNFISVLLGPGSNTEKRLEEVQPCGLLDMEEKCIIVSESLPKRQKRRIRNRRNENLYVQLSEAMEWLELICIEGCTTIGPHDKGPPNKNNGPCKSFSTCQSLQL